VRTYFAYGLRIRSAVPLPELVAFEGAEADAIIRTGAIDWRPDKYDAARWFEVTAEGVYLSWEGVGKFLVSRGREITMDPCQGAEQRLLRLPLLGTALALLLHQRGLLVLHASAIDVRGRGVAFLGSKGRGKSTMAAALYARGHRLLSDDIVAIDEDESGCPQVLPGFPQFKLWPQAAASSLGDDPALLPELARGLDKRARRAADRFSLGPVPLANLYALAEGNEARLKPLGSQASLRQLVAHSYVTRFGGELLRGEQGASHLRHCANLIRRASAFEFRRPDSLDLLGETAALVERQLTNSAERRAAARPNFFSPGERFPQPGRFTES
jgi:hypothetical protein